MNIVEKVNELNKQIEALKAEFKQHISNKAIPLDERWELFMSAPDNLREHYCYMANFAGLPHDDFVGYDGPVYAERHERVNVNRFIEVFEEIEEYDIDPSEIDIVAFKEDVLSRNLYSFEYDW